MPSKTCLAPNCDYAVIDKTNDGVACSEYCSEYCRKMHERHLQSLEAKEQEEKAAVKAKEQQEKAAVKAAAKSKEQQEGDLRRLADLMNAKGIRLLEIPDGYKIEMQ